MGRTWWGAPWLALVACAAPLAAQTTPARVAGIVIDRQNVFDDSESGFWLTRLINKLHITTLPHVVRRELLVAVGDPVDSFRLAESERNLRRLGVFRSVSLDTVRTDSGVVVQVTTRDGWSTRLDPRLGLTDGQATYSLALIEDNLLGTTAKAQVTYRKDPDRVTTSLQLRQPRLIAGRIGGSLAYFDRSDGRALSGSLARPFFAAADTSAFQVDFDTRRERVLRFRDGREAASDTLQRRFVFGRVRLARALVTRPGGYLRAGVLAQVRRDDFVSQQVADLTGGIPGRSVTAAFGGSIELTRLDYLKVRAFQSLDRDEDVNLSRVVAVGLLVAPSALGYRRDGIAPWIVLQSGARIPGGFVQGEAWAGGLYTRAGLDSGRTVVSATAVLLPSPGQHVVVHAEAGMARNPLPGAEFDLGGATGPRAFRQHAFTGDRMYALSAEYRRALTPELFKFVTLGAAAFIDHGGATWHGMPMRQGTNIGVGLRMNLSRASEADAIRFDWARRLGSDTRPAKWVFTIGKGFVFPVRP